MIDRRNLAKGAAWAAPVVTGEGTAEQAAYQPRHAKETR